MGIRSFWPASVFLYMLHVPKDCVVRQVRVREVFLGRAVEGVVVAFNQHPQLGGNLLIIQNWGLGRRPWDSTLRSAMSRAYSERIFLSRMEGARS